MHETGAAAVFVVAVAVVVAVVVVVAFAFAVVVAGGGHTGPFQGGRAHHEHKPCIHVSTSDSWLCQTRAFFHASPPPLVSATHMGLAVLLRDDPVLVRLDGRGVVLDTPANLEAAGNA